MKLSLLESCVKYESRFWLRVSEDIIAGICKYFSLCLSCYNKIPHTGWLQQQTFKTFISHNSGGWEVRESRSTVCWGTTPWFEDKCLLIVFSHGRKQKEKQPLCVFSCKGTNSTYESSTLKIQWTPKGPTSKYNHIGD